MLDARINFIFLQIIMQTTEPYGTYVLCFSFIKSSQSVRIKEKKGELEDQVAVIWSCVLFWVRHVGAEHVPNTHLQR